MIYRNIEHSSKIMFQIPYYLGSFNDNYIMFRNVEIFPKQIQTTKNCEGKY